MTNILDSLAASLSGRYRIERELGQGGMATVYLAYDLKLCRPVAIKVLRPELAAMLGPERFQREIELTARLSHSRILAIHDSGSAGGLLYYVMPYVLGESLRARLDRARQLPLEEAVGLIVAISSAIEYAHRQGVVHRDIKPENVLLADEGVLVADFGIARALAAEGSDRLTQTGLAIGTPAYMSPEQGAGESEVDGRSDEFALGCLLYEMLVGEPPFRGPTSQAIAARRATEPMPSICAVRPGVPASLERVVRRALEKAPADRFATVQAFADAVAGAAQEPATVPSRVGGGTRRTRVGVLVAGIAALAVAAYALSRRPAPAAARPVGTVGGLAVLAFDDLTGVAADSILATALPAELAGELRKVPGLRVAAAVSAFSYRGTQVSLDSVGRALAVRRLVTGSLRRSSRGDSLRIDAQLLDAATGRRVWVGHFDAAGALSFAQQDSIVLSIVSALQGRVGEDTRRLVVNHGTSDLAAQAAYFRGRQFVAARRRLDLAIEAFDEAIRRDSSYARAWAGRADAYAFSGLICCGMEPHDAIPLARSAVLRALELDPASAEAHTSLAIIQQMGDKDYRAARAELDTALVLDSTYAEAHLFLAWDHALRREDSASVAEARTALRLSPRSPIISVRLATMYYMARQYDAAIAQFKRTMEIDPAAPSTHNALAEVYARVGRCGEALQELATAAGRGPWLTAPPGVVLALCHHESDARRSLAEMLARSRSGAYVASWTIAQIYLGLGDRDRFFSWFERALDDHEPVFPTGPIYDPVREDPRFKALVKRWVT